MILFLDIDGVLMPCDGRCEVAPAVIENVARFMLAGYRIVLHSTWRMHPYSLADAELLMASIGAQLAGVVDVNEPSKARAIAAWLDDEFGPEWPDGITVVDDDSIELRGVRVIRPVSNVGWIEPATAEVMR